MLDKSIKEEEKCVLQSETLNVIIQNNVFLSLLFGHQSIASSTPVSSPVHWRVYNMRASEACEPCEADVRGVRAMRGMRARHARHARQA